MKKMSRFSIFVLLVTGLVFFAQASGIYAQSKAPKPSQKEYTHNRKETTRNSEHRGQLSGSENQTSDDRLLTERERRKDQFTGTQNESTPEPKRNHNENKTNNRRDEDTYRDQNTNRKNTTSRNTRNTENYFRVENGSSLWDGKYWELSDLPIKVYVAKLNSQYMKQKYYDYVDYGFKVWEKFDSRIKHKMVTSRKNADVIIEFEEDLSQKYGENYLGLTSYETGKNNNITQSTIEISLYRYDNQSASDTEVKETIVHEIGHALGLGHSDNELDLMYPIINELTSPDMSYTELSQGDQEAIISQFNWAEKKSSK